MCVSVCVFQIGNCKNVTVMSLRSNKLEFLPDEIGQMTKLRVLNLSDNRYKHKHTHTQTHTLSYVGYIFSMAVSDLKLLSRPTVTMGMDECVAMVTRSAGCTVRGQKKHLSSLSYHSLPPSLPG